MLGGGDRSLLLPSGGDRLLVLVDGLGDAAADGDGDGLAAGSGSGGRRLRYLAGGGLPSELAAGMHASSASAAASGGNVRRLRCGHVPQPSQHWQCSRAACIQAEGTMTAWVVEAELRRASSVSIAIHAVLSLDRQGLKRRLLPSSIPARIAPSALRSAVRVDRGLDPLVRRFRSHLFIFCALASAAAALIAIRVAPSISPALCQVSAANSR